jgi:hypothetical protein
LGLAGFAVIQLRNANVAKQRTQEELIHSAWTSLQPLQTGFCEGTSLDYGLRALYCKIKPFVDYAKLSVISGLPIFNKGPHTDNNLNFEGGYEFGYYNPEFLKWIQEKAINPNDGKFKEQIQPAYNDKIKVVARAFYQTHKILFATPEEFEAFKKKYEDYGGKEGGDYKDPEPLEVIKSEYQDHLTNKDLPEYYFEQKFWNLALYLSSQNEHSYERQEEQLSYKYVAETSGGFWVRRSIDGTEKQFFDILTKLLEIYDSDWLSEQKLLDTKPSQ